MLARLCWQGVRDLLRRPWSLGASLAAVAVTVYLGGLFALALNALDTEFFSQRGRIQFQVYWRVGADPGLTARQWDWMRTLPYPSALRTFTPGQALELMRQTLDPQTDLGWLRGQNPLPFTALLSFRLPPSDPDFAKTMLSRLDTMEGVATVRFNAPQVDLAQAIGLVSRRVVWPLAALLAFLIALVVGNTVRLSFARRRDEVEVMRLVGAREWWIRLPLVSGAAFLGATGSLAGLGLLHLTQSAMADVLNVPPLWVHLPFLPAATVIGGLAATTLVAAAAGFLAARA
jgi:cell division transport system permease protein